jgi:methyl-accepting chemotaxis protein
MTFGTSFRIFSGSKPVTGNAADGTKSLRRRFVVTTGAAAIAVLLGLSWMGNLALSASMTRQENGALADAARRSALLVERVLAERLRQVDLVAWETTVIDAAVKGTALSRARTLPLQTIPALEERFKKARSQQVDTQALEYLLDLMPKLDIAEVMLTDQYGYNAVVTSPPSDFVQSDEPWWQHAWKDGVTEAAATEDRATGETVVELARVVRNQGIRVGVVKAKFGLTSLDTALVQASAGSALRVDLVDSTGHVIASSAGGTRFNLLSGFGSLAHSASDSALTYGAAGTPQRGVVMATNGGHWKLVAHVDEASALAPLRRAQLGLLGGTGLLLLAIVGALLLVSRSIENRITRPAAELAALAEAVAGGDLSRQLSMVHADDEIGRLSRAVAAMVGELRRLTMALSAAAQETSAMSAEITAGTEEMAASAGEIAHTASDLSAQSGVMAQSIQALSRSTEQLVQLAAELTDGAHEGVARNVQLRDVAHESRARLDESSRHLEALSVDVEASASAIEGLASASLEVRTFVALVQKLARQSKLLALNAAMEAARAGEHGEGFAVVATEVRRLSAMSSEAAERTERVVHEVLKGIETSRKSSERAVLTARSVHGAIVHGVRSFAAVEGGVAGAEAWTASIERTATVANTLVGEITARLTQLSGGTESFAAAMQQVAASSEEQSASTEEIAAAASALTSAAERLSRLVANLRLEGEGEAGPDVPPAAFAPRLSQMMDRASPAFAPGLPRGATA